MRSLLLSVASLLLATSANFAQTKVMHTVAAGEAKPAGQPNYAPLVNPPGRAAALDSTIRITGATPAERLKSMWLDHECAPDGCPKPLGCGNFWTEKKFIFGSCRQFFGTAGASVGHHRKTVAP